MMIIDHRGSIHCHCLILNKIFIIVVEREYFFWAACSNGNGHKIFHLYSSQQQAFNNHNPEIPQKLILTEMNRVKDEYLLIFGPKINYLLNIMTETAISIIVSGASVSKHNL